MSSFHNLAVTSSSPLAVIASLVVTMMPAAARADEPPAPVPLPTPPPPTARSAHELTMSELGDRLDELRMRARVEGAEAFLDRQRNDRTAPPRFGPGRLGRGSVVLPDLFGLSSLPVAGVPGLAGVGGVLFTGPISFGFTSSEGGSHSSSIGLTPSFDVFVSDHVTLGGRIGAFRSTATYVQQPATGGATTATTSSEGYAIGIAPRVGYVLPLTESLALWPQVGLDVYESRTETDGTGRTLWRSFGAEVELGLLVPLGSHVVVRLAPTLAYSHASSDGPGLSGLSGDGDSVRAGVRGQIGLAF